MITRLNHNTSWTKIYKINLDDRFPKGIESYEEYLTNQIDILVSQEYELGFILRGITMCKYNYILVFTPNPKD